MCMYRYRWIDIISMYMYKYVCTYAFICIYHPNYHRPCQIGDWKTTFSGSIPYEGGQ